MEGHPDRRQTFSLPDGTARVSTVLHCVHRNGRQEDMDLMRRLYCSVVSATLSKLMDDGDIRVPLTNAPLTHQTVMHYGPGNVKE